MIGVVVRGSLWAGGDGWIHVSGEFLTPFFSLISLLKKWKFDVWFGWVGTLLDLEEMIMERKGLDMCLSLR